MWKITITYVIPMSGDWSQNALFVTGVHFRGPIFSEKFSSYMVSWDLENFHLYLAKRTKAQL